MNDRTQLIEKIQLSSRRMTLKIISYVLGGWSLLLLTISLICYIFSVSNEKWYLNADTVTCQITNHHIIDESCYSGTCYDGKINFNYSISGKKYTKEEMIVYHEYDKSTVIEKINKFPIGSNHTCWYKIADPSDATIMSQNHYNNYVASIIFLVIGASFFLLSGGMLIYTFSMNR